MSLRTRRSLRSVYVWHRWLGVISALIVLMLAATGLLLNHSHELQLDSRYISNAATLNWYGVRATPPREGFLVGGHWISTTGDRLFLDAKPVVEAHGSLLTAASCDGLIMAIFPESVLLLTSAGGIVETLHGEALPGVIAAAVFDDGSPVIETDGGRFRSNCQLLEWMPFAGSMPARTSPQPIPADVASRVAQAAAAMTISREKLLVDLHSGRLFGRYGPLAMDAAAIGFMALALSGLWLWVRHLRHQRRRERPQRH